MKRVRWATEGLFALLIALPAAAQWPFRTGTPLQNPAAPAIADLDGDGEVEVVFVSWDGFLYCTDAAGRLRWRRSLDDGYGFPPQLGATPALGDVDGDPRTLEVLAGSGEGRAAGDLWVLDAAGTVLAKVDLPSAVSGAPLLLDTDGDGTLEAYVPLFDGQPDNLWAFDMIASGGAVSPRLRWKAAVRGGTGTASGGIFTTPAAADLDGDGAVELVVPAGALAGTSIGGDRLFALAAADGSVRWSFVPADREAFWDAAPVIADVDADGRQEVLIGGISGRFYRIDGATGAPVWVVTTNGSIQKGCAVADLDRDGNLDIVAGSWRTVYCFDARGRTRWAWAHALRSSFSAPSIGDLDHDGELEIVLGTDPSSGPGEVVALDHRGHLAWSARQPAAVLSPPSLGDLDRDGTLEVCFGVYDGSYNALRADGSQFVLAGRGPFHDPRPWPSARRSARNDGAYRRDVEARAAAPAVVARGTPLVYGVDLDNTTPSPIAAALWIELVPPGGPAGVVAGPVAVLLPPGRLAGALTVPIPAAAPLGTWAVRVNAARSAAGLTDRGVATFTVQ